MALAFFCITMAAIGLFALFDGWRDWRRGRVASGDVPPDMNIDADRDEDPGGFWQGIAIKAGAGVFCLGWALYSYLTGHLPGGG